MYKYQMIVEDIRKKINKGSLEQGERLPSIRTLAENYNCNKDTIIKALQLLCHQNVIYAVEKSGYYLSKTSDKSTIKRFELSMPEYAKIPFNDFQQCINQALAASEDYLYQLYPERRGLDDLISSVHKLLASYGIYTSAEQLVISSGVQQALYILLEIARSEFKAGKNKIIIEQPTYSRMNYLLKQLKINYHIVERSLAGIDFKLLEKLFASGEYCYFYTVSRQHNPLGVSYTESQKQTLADLARRYNVYIIEDDFRADFAKPASAPIHYYDTANKVIYLKSFSPIVFPSLRLGAIILPPSLEAKFMLYKQMIDYDVNIILQKALSLYIDNGMLQRHRQKIIAYNKYQSEAVKKILLESQLDFIKITNYNLIGVIPSNIQPAQLLKNLSKNQIDFMEESYLNYCPYHYFRIKYLDKELAEVKQILHSIAENVTMINAMNN